jgi:hypothetical protein
LEDGDLVAGSSGQLLLKCHILFLHVSQSHLEVLVLPLDLLLLSLQCLDLLTLALPGRLSCSAVAEDALHSSLLLLVFSLGAFSWWKVGLGLWKLLSPRFPLLHLLLLGGGGVAENALATNGAAEHTIVLIGPRSHDIDVDGAHGVVGEERRVLGAGG